MKGASLTKSVLCLIKNKDELLLLMLFCVVTLFKICFLDQKIQQQVDDETNETMEDDLKN